jgi:uncharacterized protein (DUF2236 family)
MPLTELLLPRLSAHLAELTKNQTYQSAALLAAQFQQSQLLVPASNLVQDGFDLNTTQSCRRLSSDPRSEYNSPLMEAYAILADITNDDKWRTQCVVSSVFMRLDG